ncbi:MAG: MotA/TolQ/ExbB proton channel family protein, partial [Megasphaera micronuciformis]
MDKIYAAIQLLESGGPVMIPLFILSVITIAIAIERGIYYKRNRKKSQSFFSHIEGAAKSGDWKVAEEVCEHSRTAISRIIAAGLQDDSTEESMKSAFSEQMALESAAFQRYLDYLSA